VDEGYRVRRSRALIWTKGEHRRRVQYPIMNVLLVLRVFAVWFLMNHHGMLRPP
jgi:hypothetical protein